MSSKALIIGAIFIAIGLIVFGRSYGGGNAGISGNTNLRHGQAGSSASPRTTEAPEVSLEKLGGGTITLSEYRGQKPVILDFWASWCPNCRRDMPNLNRFYEKYKDEVEVIGINLQERKEVVEDFVNSGGISFPIALDPRGTASLSFGIQYTNTHILIDKNGNVLRVIPGDIKESDIKSLLDS